MCNSFYRGLFICNTRLTHPSDNLEVVNVPDRPADKSTCKTRDVLTTKCSLIHAGKSTHNRVSCLLHKIKVRLDNFWYREVHMYISDKVAGT